MSTMMIKLGVVLAAATVAAQSSAQTPAAVAAGSYECWAHGAARMLMNFNVTGKDRYTDPEGKERGAFTYNATTGAITFKGGHLDGVMPTGFTSIYHEKNNKPTVSFRGRSGGEAAFCERIASNRK